MRPLLPKVSYKAAESHSQIRQAEEKSQPNQVAKRTLGKEKAAKQMLKPDQLPERGLDKVT